MTPSFLEEHLPFTESHDDVEGFVCGPKAFEEAALKMWSLSKLPAAKLRTESFAYWVWAVGNSWIQSRNFDFLKGSIEMSSWLAGGWLVKRWKIQANCIWPKKESRGIPFLQAACCVNRWLTILESHIWSFPFQVRPVTSAGNRAKVSLEIFDLIKEGWSLATHQFMDLMISFRP